MKPVSKTSRGPPKAACVIKGERHYNVPEAARLIGVVCESTLPRWAVKGWTSYGMSLNIVKRNGHLLIPEFQALAVKELHEEHPLPRPGTPADVRDEFRFAVRTSMFNLIRPRSAYSRARNPHILPR